MKICKIILIVIYILDIIWNIIKTLAADGDEQVEQLVITILHGLIYGILYSGAGIFDI